MGQFVILQDQLQLPIRFHFDQINIKIATHSRKPKPCWERSHQTVPKEPLDPSLCMGLKRAWKPRKPQKSVTLKRKEGPKIV